MGLLLRSTLNRIRGRARVMTRNRGASEVSREDGSDLPSFEMVVFGDRFRTIRRFGVGLGVGVMELTIPMTTRG
jgi:hypothetical protein